MVDKPLPHQLKAAKILGARSILADKRGLGKTLSSLLWAEEARRLLVIAPKEVAENFLEEINLWYPDRKPFDIIAKPAPIRRAILYTCQVLDKFTVVVNLEAWRKDKQLVRDLIDLKFDTIIIDEAHNIKDEGTVAFQGVRDIVYTPNICSSCGHGNLMTLENGIFCTNCYNLNTAFNSASYIQMLTGTPILNHPSDLFPLLHLKDREKFPDKDSYLRKYCKQRWDGRWQFLPGAEKRLLEYLGNDYMARTREDAGIVIPKQKPQIYHIEFNKNDHPKQWEIYQQLQEAAAIKIAEEETLDVMSMLALITRLRQAIVWPAGMRIPIKDEDGNILDYWQCDIEQSCKLDAAEKLTKELLDEQHRVVLYSRFKPPLRELHRRFGSKSIVLDGGTSANLRREIRRDFDRRTSRNTWQVLLANSKVGGESLNFNAATAGIVIDREWNPGREDQQAGRIDRLGQTEESLFYVLRASPSIDDWHADIIKYKLDIWANFEEVRRKLREFLDGAL